MALTESTEELARRVIGELYKTVLTHEESVLEGQVEAIHDMRVATRRLRVALRNFAVCCQPEERRRLNARLQQLATALGEVRDFDVLMTALKQLLLSRPPAERIYIAAFIRRLRDRRRRRLRRLQAFLRGEDYAVMKGDFPSLLNPAVGIEQTQTPIHQTERREAHG
jgi:CHAD domain-containing protein